MPAEVRKGRRCADAKGKNLQNSFAALAVDGRRATTVPGSDLDISPLRGRNATLHVVPERAGGSNRRWTTPGSAWRAQAQRWVASPPARRSATS